MLSPDSKQTDVSRLDTLLLDSLLAETQSVSLRPQASRLVRFSLDAQDSVLLPLEDLIEILSVEAANILPIPDMPNAVIGICNWRGDMLWLVDFNQFAGYPSLIGQHAAPLSVLVTQSNEQTIGVAVSQVQDIELHDLQRLQPAAIGFFPPNLAPLVRGVLPGCCDAVLNLNPLMQSPLWKKHPEEQR